MRYIKRRNPVTTESSQFNRDRIEDVLSAIQDIVESYGNLNDNIGYLVSIVNKDSLRYGNDRLTKKFRKISDEIDGSIDLNADNIIGDIIDELEEMASNTTSS